MYIIMNAKDPKNMFLWSQQLYSTKESARETIVKALRAGQILHTLENYSIHRIEDIGTVFTFQESFSENTRRLNQEL